MCKKDYLEFLFIAVAVLLVLIGTYHSAEKRMEEITNNEENRLMIDNTKEVLGGRFLFDGKIYIPELSAKDMVDRPVVYKRERFGLLRQDEMIDLEPFQCVQEDTGEKVICYFLFTKDISPEIKAVGKMPENTDKKTP